MLSVALFVQVKADSLREALRHMQRIPASKVRVLGGKGGRVVERETWGRKARQRHGQRGKETGSLGATWSLLVAPRPVSVQSSFVAPSFESVPQHAALAQQQP